MFLGFLALITSFCISAIAIFFSVTGWAALFAAAAIPVMLMFGSIEIGKLVAVAFLHWHWNDMGLRLKYLITSMILVAMLITSVGIYGFLAKGHLDQEIPVDSAILKIERIDKRIVTEEAVIRRLENRLNQLDASIQVYIDREYVTRGLKARNAQKEERELIDNGINFSYNRIDKYEEAKLVLNEKIGSIQAKLGPIKYVTQILNVENKDMAVQIVIIMSMFTFDPFAIALLLAAMWSFKHATIRKQTGEKLLSGYHRGVDIHTTKEPRTEARNTEDHLREETSESKGTNSDETPKDLVSKSTDEHSKPVSPRPTKVNSKDAGRHGDLKWRKK